MLFLLFVSYGLCFGIQNKLPFLYSKAYLETGVPDRLGDKLLYCTYCTGFHCGWVTWLLMMAVKKGSFTEGIGWQASLEGIGFAFASSGFCYIADVVTKWAESNTAVVEEE